MIRALVIEDSELYAYFTRSVLEQAGFEVAVSTTADDALARARELAPALICVDYRLGSGMRGDALCRLLRAEPATRDAAIILLSAEPGVGTGGRAEACGADLFLEKSSNPQVLLDAIASARARASRG